MIRHWTWLDRGTWLLLGAAVAVLALHDLEAHDLWWQLRTGQWVLEHGWPERDPFSYWVIDRPWIELRWLFCVTISLIHSALGAPGLVIGKVLLLLGTFGLLAAAARRPLHWTTSLALAAGVSLAHFRFVVRPELVSFLLVSFTLLALERSRRGGARGWPLSLPLVQVVWTNAHTTFVLGPVIQWAWFLADRLTARWQRPWLDGGQPEKRRRLLGWVALASTLACFVNPWGWRGAVFPFQLLRQISGTDVSATSSASLNDLISEFQSPFANPRPDLFLITYLLVVLASGASFWWVRSRLPVARLAIWAAFFGLSLLAVRNVALFGYVAAFTLLLNLGESPSRQQPRVGPGLLAGLARIALPVILVVVIALTITDHGNRLLGSDRRIGVGVSELRYPLGAMAFIERERLPRRLVASFADSNYVLYREGERSVLCDGRLEVYGPELIARGLAITCQASNWDQVTEDLQIHTAIIRLRDALTLQHLRDSSDWSAVYYDHLHVVFVRNRALSPEILDRWRIDWTAPPPPPATHGEAEIPRRIGGLFLSMGNVDAARAALEESIALFPDEEAALLLGLIYQAEGREDDARPLLARVRRSTWQRPELHVTSGEILERLGKLDAAAEAFQQALDLGRSRATVSPFLYQGLVRVHVAREDWEAVQRILGEQVRAFPGDPEAWSNLGRVCVRRDDLAAAQVALEAALRLAPAQPRAQHLIGTVYARTGQIERARKAFEKTLELDPQHPLAREHLQALEQLR